MNQIEFNPRNRRGESRRRAAIKGTLIWGTLLSTAATGTAFAAASSADSESFAFPSVLGKSMIVCYPLGAASGLLMHHLAHKRRKAALDRKTERWLNERLPRKSRSRAA